MAKTKAAKKAKSGSKSPAKKAKKAAKGTMKTKAASPKKATKKATKKTPKLALSAKLRAEITSRAKTAFSNFSANIAGHVTRCHRVTKDTLTYRLPAEARACRGEGVVVKLVKGEVKITDKIVKGLVPVLGWPSC